MGKEGSGGNASAQTQESEKPTEKHEEHEEKRGLGAKIKSKLHKPTMS
jgi:hypothetical protein